MPAHRLGENEAGANARMVAMIFWGGLYVALLLVSLVAGLRELHKRCESRNIQRKQSKD